VLLYSNLHDFFNTSDSGNIALFIMREVEYLFASNSLLTPSSLWLCIQQYTRRYLREMLLCLSWFTKLVYTIPVIKNFTVFKSYDQEKPLKSFYNHINLWNMRWKFGFRNILSQAPDLERTLHFTNSYSTGKYWEKKAVSHEILNWKIEK
jgi:hypothetical protein